MKYSYYFHVTLRILSFFSLLRSVLIAVKCYFWILRTFFTNFAYCCVKLGWKTEQLWIFIDSCQNFSKTNIRREFTGVLIFLVAWRWQLSNIIYGNSYFTNRLETSSFQELKKNSAPFSTKKFRKISYRTWIQNSIHNISE